MPAEGPGRSDGAARPQSGQPGEERAARNRPPVTYELTLAGQAGGAVRAELDDLVVTIRSGTTTWRVQLPDGAALPGLIQRVIDLRLQPVRVALLASHEADGDGPDPDPGPSRATGVTAAETLVGALGFEVVNRLFSVGLTLSGARRLVGDGPVGERLDRAVDQLDEAIAQIRSLALRAISGDPAR